MKRSDILRVDAVKPATRDSTPKLEAVFECLWVRDNHDGSRDFHLSPAVRVPADPNAAIWRGMPKGVVEITLTKESAVHFKPRKHYEITIKEIE